MTFKEQLESDLNVIYNTDEFATAALYKGVFISVIFSDQYEVQSSKHKMITIRREDAPDIKEGERLEINGTTYTIDNSEYKDETTQLEWVVGIWSE